MSELTQNVASTCPILQSEVKGANPNVTKGNLMIPRYSRPDMVQIWSPESKFRIWYEIEAHACDAMADLGVIPRENADAVWKAKDVEFDVARIDEIEAVTKHDVIAFLTHLAEHVGSEEARFVHQGMTSSDVLDTCFNIQLVRATDILLADMDQLLAALKRRAQEHKMTVRIGRSHGIHAEPLSGFVGEEVGEDVLFNANGVVFVARVQHGVRKLRRERIFVEERLGARNEGLSLKQLVDARSFPGVPL